MAIKNVILVIEDIPPSPLTTLIITPKLNPRTQEHERLKFSFLLQLFQLSETSVFYAPA